MSNINNGDICALLDEYERALNEFKEVINEIPNEVLTVILDHQTNNPECKSIQTILSHVVKAGYWYAIEIRKSEGEELERPINIELNTIKEYQNSIDEMFNYTKTIFKDYPSIDIYKQSKFRWENIPSTDIMLEHAIVHILRYRRQIEKFKLKLATI